LSAEITWWESAVLGLVPGLTEFIPVSSSAHLNIVHRVFGQDRNLTFDVMLQVGTTAALVWYFRHDWKALLTDASQKKLRNLIFLGCVPAVVFGVLLKPLQERALIFTDVKFNAIMLIVAGLLLLAADRLGRKEREVESVTTKDALWVGFSQALALVPGVSRSGSTMTMGMLLGLTRESAARFSFLMSLPITLGAVLYEAKDLLRGEEAVSPTPWLVMVVGVLTAAISGFWAISFLLNFLKQRDVMPFVIWRVFVAVVVLGLVAAGKL